MQAVAVLRGVHSSAITQLAFSHDGKHNLSILEDVHCMYTCEYTLLQVVQCFLQFTAAAFTSCAGAIQAL
jgi:hypothetical protein